MNEFLAIIITINTFVVVNILTIETFYALLSDGVPGEQDKEDQPFSNPEDKSPVSSNGCNTHRYSIIRSRLHLKNTTKNISEAI